MRLLNTNSRLFEEFPDNQIPEYVILSHRWDGQEISYQEFRAAIQENSIGSSRFSKILKFSDLAADNGFQYAWIDTCCINKESSAELTEAINSMFHWYENAQKCYVYMSDVTWKISDGMFPKFPRQKFMASKWFTRGWTLQELLAPGCVVFYDEEWKIIGYKDDLAAEISAVTSIDTALLLGQRDLRDACVAEKMSWAANRETSREEDRAYSLMGLFDVNMPLLYGEGRKAFMRLQLEIIKNNADESVFAWRDENSHEDGMGLLASWPDAFRDSGNVMIRPPGCRTGFSKTIRRPYSITDQGLKFNLNLIGQAVEHANEVHTVIKLPLNCWAKTKDGTESRYRQIAVKLQASENRWERIECERLELLESANGALPRDRGSSAGNSYTTPIYIRQHGMYIR